jgi:hypothetical protein
LVFLGGGIERGGASLGVGVDDRKLEVVHFGLEVQEQLLDLGDHLSHPCVGAVDLVDDHDGGQVELQRLAQHEAGLRQWTLGGIDEQEDAVHHRQRTLHLAAEVGVAGGVDDVELDLARLAAAVLR